MAIIIIEILISVVSLYLIGKKVFHFFHFKEKAFLMTIFYSVVYFLVIYLSKDTYLGNEVLGKFIEQSVAKGAVLPFIIYPIIISFSEELFFRLYLSEKNKMFLAALLFTVLHWRPNNFPLLMFPVLFVFALTQWSLLKKSKSLWPVVITHLITIYALLIIYA